MLVSESQMFWNWEPMNHGIHIFRHKEKALEKYGFLQAGEKMCK